MAKKKKSSGKKNKLIFNRVRYKKIKDSYFLTTDDGSWVLLDEKDFKAFEKEKLDARLTQLFEDNSLIITPNNENKVIEKTKEKYGFLYGGANLHIIVPSLRCNMKCVYCHASSVPANKKGYDMTKETAKKTVDFIMQSPNQFLNIEFQGGEPLLQFETIKYIIDCVKEKNAVSKKSIQFTIVTNLNAIDKKKLEYLIENNVAICTSLDGPKEIHDANRPLGINSGSYENVVKWTKIVQEECDKRGNKNKPGALLTVTKIALKNPKKIVDEYVACGFESIHLRFMNSLGCASGTWSDIGYTAEEFIDFWKKAMDYIIQLNIKGTIMKERLVMVILRKLLSIRKGEDYLDLRSPCGAAIGQLLYNYDGSIYTCDEGRMVGNDIFKIGTVDQKYPEVLTSNKVCAIVSSSINDCFICDDCVYKPYCGLCPVCNYFEQGSIIAKVPETKRCKIYMAMFDYIAEKYFFDNNAKKVFESWLDEKNIKRQELNIKKKRN
jgi:His-Xaa-Ser system radical SAM maturase HxsB